jgi:hypothetical protein
MDRNRLKDHFIPNPPFDVTNKAKVW